MGSGLALQIRKKWPIVYDKYVEDCKPFKETPNKLLGHVQDLMVESNIIIANCYGQVYPSRNGVMTDYNAWDKILDKLNDLTNYFSLDLHFPYMIGCGLAGGDWNIMSEKIERHFKDSKIKAFIHKL